MKRERKLINVSQEGITCLWFVVLLSVGVLLGSNPAYAQPFAYVTNVGTGDVSVIDTATNQVIDVDPTTPALDNIPVGDGPFAVAITPDGAFAYVANSESNTVSVIDTATNTVIDVDPTTPALDNIPVGGEPVGVAITPDGAFVYVANTFGGTVSVIDTATNQVIDVDPTTPALDNIPVGGEPLGVAITPNGAFVYVAIPDTVSVIDTATNQVIDVDPTTPALDNIPVGGNPFGVAITPDGAFVYVTSSGSNTVSVIDTATNQVIDVDPTTPALDNIPVGDAPTEMAITPDGAFVYVANSGSVSVIDTATNQVIDVDPTTPALDNIPVGSPRGPAITPDGAFVYVASLFSDTVSVIDTATNQVIDVDPTTPALDNIPVGSFPVIVAITPLLDSDDDGIPDAVDNCPGTPAGETVDANGCTQEQATQNQIDVLQDIVADPSTDPELAEEVEDVIPSLQTALVELNKTPPDNQAAVGNIEGAVGDLEATIGLDPAQDPVLTDLMNQLAGVAQQLAVDAIAEAIAQGGDSGEISDAQVSLMEGDALRASEAFKDAVNKYKDALAKAESAIS